MFSNESFGVMCSLVNDSVFSFHSFLIRLKKILRHQNGNRFFWHCQKNASMKSSQSWHGRFAARRNEIQANHIIWLMLFGLKSAVKFFHRNTPDGNIRRWTLDFKFFEGFISGLFFRDVVKNPFQFQGEELLQLWLARPYMVWYL